MSTKKFLLNSSKVFLIIGFLFASGFVIAGGITSSEVDDVCAVNNASMLRNSGQWKCFNHAFGEMHFHNDSAGVVVALTQNVWANASVFSTYYSGNNTLNVNHSNSQLIINIGGMYKMDHSFTFTGTANNKYHGVLGANGDPILNTETHSRTGTGADVQSASGTGIARLSTGDVITLLLLNEDSGGDATVFSANVNLQRIGF